MTKRYPLGSALGGRDSGDAGGFEGVAFGIFELADGGDDPRRHIDEGVGGSSAVGDGFACHVHHSGFAASVVMGEFGHGIQDAGLSLLAPTTPALGRKLAQIYGVRYTLPTVPRRGTSVPSREQPQAA